MRLFSTAFATVVQSVQTLNRFGLIVSGLWLLIILEWGAVILGGFAILLAPKLIRLSMVPGRWVSGFAEGAFENGNRTGFMFFSSIAALLTTAGFALWAASVFYMFDIMHKDGTDIPWLTWSYCVATHPIRFLAYVSREQGQGYGDTFTALLFCVSCFAVMTLATFGPPGFLAMAGTFAIVQISGMLYTLFRYSKASPALRSIHS